jgi:hypothetical protein
MTTAPTPPAGWCPDPSGAPGQRYYDGKQWTQHLAYPPLKVRKPMPTWLLVVRTLHVVVLASAVINYILGAVH